jgi:hypothetical protein
MAEEHQIEKSDEPEVDVIEDISSLPDPREEGNRRREMGWRDKSRQSLRMDTLTWAVILIWAGAVMLLAIMGVLSGLLSRFNLRLADVPWQLPVSDEVWTVFFAGLGVILILGVVIRLLVPRFRHDLLGNIILAIVAFSVAFGRADIIWPLILIALGVAIILRRRG